MNQQINQVIQTMAAMMLLSMTTGMVLLQRGNEHPPKEVAIFEDWFRTGSTIKVYPLLPDNELQIATRRLRLSGRYTEADMAEYVQSNPGVSLIKLIDYYEDLSQRYVGYTLTMLVEHGIVTIKGE